MNFHFGSCCTMVYSWIGWWAVIHDKSRTKYGEYLWSFIWCLCGKWWSQFSFWWLDQVMTYFDSTPCESCSLKDTLAVLIRLFFVVYPCGSQTRVVGIEFRQQTIRPPWLNCLILYSRIIKKLDQEPQWVPASWVDWWSSDLKVFSMLLCKTNQCYYF